MLSGRRQRGSWAGCHRSEVSICGLLRYPGDRGRNSGHLRLVPFRMGLGVCDSLNVIGPHNLTKNGTIRRCGFVGVSMALLEEVRQYGGGF